MPPALTRGQIWSVALLAGACALSYALTGIFRHGHFDTSFDLGIFDQAVWHLSRFETPASSIKGLGSVFADHFHPIIVLLAPLYWMAPSPNTLIAAQGVLFGASIVPVFVFLRRRLPYGVALTMSAAYGLFWGLQRAAVSDFHEIAFAPLIIAILIDAMDRRSWTIWWLACLGLALVKEDLLPLLTVVGLYVAVSGEPRRGLSLAAGSLLAFVLVTRVIVPWLGAGSGYAYLGTFGDLLQRPWALPLHLVVPATKVLTLLLWLAPFAFLSLRSPYVILLVPLVLERFLSSNSLYWSTSFHYSAALAPILAMSAGDGLARLVHQRSAPWRSRLLIGAAAASLLLSSLLPGRQPLWKLMSAGPYRSVPFETTARRALALIPPDASVVAQAAVLPHLSERLTIYVLQAGAPDAEFVVASRHLSPWPAATFEEIVALTDERRRQGYTVVFEDDGWTVLHRAP